MAAVRLSIFSIPAILSKKWRQVVSTTVAPTRRRSPACQHHRRHWDAKFWRKVIELRFGIFKPYIQRRRRNTRSIPQIANLVHSWRNVIGVVCPSQSRVPLDDTLLYKFHRVVRHQNCSQERLHSKQGGDIGKWRAGSGAQRGIRREFQGSKDIPRNFRVQRRAISMAVRRLKSSVPWELDITVKLDGWEEWMRSSSISDWGTQPESFQHRTFPS